jgi:hypothetical protein
VAFQGGGVTPGFLWATEAALAVREEVTGCSRSKKGCRKRRATRGCPDAFYTPVGHAGEGRGEEKGGSGRAERHGHVSRGRSQRLEADRRRWATPACIAQEREGCPVWGKEGRERALTHGAGAKGEIPSAWVTLHTGPGWKRGRELLN